MTSKTINSIDTAGSLDDWLARLFADGDLLRMGHQQRKEDLNLGLGWLYYSLARVVRPQTVVVIGSWRGFAPVVFARALLDNEEGGQVLFIDPSFVDDFWKDPENVRAHFARHGVDNVRHVLQTTQEFIETEEYRRLQEVGILFVDGYHTREQAKIDYEAFETKLSAEGMVLFHDTADEGPSSQYGPDKEYARTVKRYVHQIEQRSDLQVLDLPFASGVTLVRKT